MTASQGNRMKNPPHPCGFVKSDIVEPPGSPGTTAAMAFGVTRSALSALLNERASLSPEMALRTEKAVGVSMDTMLRMQASYDAALIRKQKPAINVRRYTPA
jgi:antitoxin HigA-1